MNWQDVAKEFGLSDEASRNLQGAFKRMAEEIILLRQRLGPAGYEMLLELKRLRSGQNEFKHWQDARIKERLDLEQKLAKALKERADFWIALMDERKALERSESKREKLRESLEEISTTNPKWDEIDINEMAHKAHRRG